MQGLITYFNPRKRFGFIATDQEEYFFFYPKQEGRKQHTVRVGDSVHFRVEVSEMKEGRLQAVIETFNGNSRWEIFVEDVRAKPIRAGYLKRIDNSWSVKIMPEKFMIRLDEISPFETNVQEVYDNRENLMVPAKLSVSKKGEVIAVLEDRKFVPEYYKATAVKASAEVIPARITGMNDHVYFATLFAGKLPVIIRRSLLPEGMQYLKGDTLEVSVTAINNSTIVVSPLAFKVA